MLGFFTGEVHRSKFVTESATFPPVGKPVFIFHSFLLPTILITLQVTWSSSLGSVMQYCMEMLAPLAASPMSTSQRRPNSKSVWVATI